MLRDEPAAAVTLRLPLAAKLDSEQPFEQAQTEAAWREFHDRLRGFVARRVRNVADAEDIVQRVFLQMHRTLGTLRHTERLGAWLYQASRNAIADHYRAPGTYREVPSGDTRDLDARDDSSASDGSDQEVSCAAECLRSLVQTLPPSYRLAIEQVELEGLSQKQAAAVSGLSVSGMKTRVQRGRRRLKALLLDHCRVAVDRRGGVVACEIRAAGRPSCGKPERDPAGARCVPAGRTPSTGEEGP